MTTILKLKHWQIFLLIYGVPLLALLLPSNNATIFPFSVLNGIAYLYLMIAQVSYSLVIGRELHKKLPSTVAISYRWIPLFFSCFCVLILIISIATWIEPRFLRDHPLVFLAAMLLSIISIFFIVRFAAKVFASAELQREATTIEYFGYFFAVWLLFMGIWFVQPKINTLITQEDVAH